MTHIVQLIYINQSYIYYIYGHIFILNIYIVWQQPLQFFSIAHITLS